MQFDGAHTLSTRLAEMTLLQIDTSAFLSTAQQELSKTCIHRMSVYQDWMQQQVELNKNISPCSYTIIPLFAQSWIIGNKWMDHLIVKNITVHFNDIVE